MMTVQYEWSAIPVESFNPPTPQALNYILVIQTLIIDPDDHLS